MSWRCVDCGREEEDEGLWMIAVCHHCGKPVCVRSTTRQRVSGPDPAFDEPHGHIVVDDAFDSGDDPFSSRYAVHCKECKAKYHRFIPEIHHEWSLITEAAP